MSLFKTLQPKPKTDGATCLLLDVSGSMDESINVNAETGDFGIRRVDQMLKVVAETPECQGLKAFTFSSDCSPIEAIPPADGTYYTGSTTNLARAFKTVKEHGFYSAILLTDGQPDNEQAALTEAYGMRLGIIYIGNPPTPAFLERLAHETNGTFAISDMRSQKQLADAIAGALPPPAAKIEPPKGPITL